MCRSITIFLDTLIYIYSKKIKKETELFPCDIPAGILVYILSLLIWALLGD